MGNNSSVEICEDAADKVQDKINRKCNTYLSSIENTNSVVDVELSDLSREISDLIDPLRTMPQMLQLGLLAMSSIVERVENYANEHKHAIRRLLEILFESQSQYEKICNTTIQQALRNDNSTGNIDELCMLEIRLKIEKSIVNYEKELHVLTLVQNIHETRCVELQRLLFKLAESTVGNAVEGMVDDIKHEYMEKIDNILFFSMSSGDFHQAEYARTALRNILQNSIVAKDTLEGLRFSRRLDIECAQDEIAATTDNIIRKVQLNYVHKAHELPLLLDLGFEDLLMDKEEELIGASSSDGSSDDGEGNGTSNSNSNGKGVVSQYITTSSLQEGDDEPEDEEDANDGVGVVEEIPSRVAKVDIDNDEEEGEEEEDESVASSDDRKTSKKRGRPSRANTGTSKRGDTKVEEKKKRVTKKRKGGQEEDGDIEEAVSQEKGGRYQTKKSVRATNKGKKN